MNQEEYLQKSQSKGLPGRCPILENCIRRAWTIYFFSDYKEENSSGDMIQTLINAGEISETFKANMIKLSGETPTISKGSKRGQFYHMCPEVNLFDYENSLGNFSKTACSIGLWDEDENPKIKIVEEKHYSDCAEFSKHLFEKNTLNKRNKVKEILQECYTYIMIDNKTGLYKIGYSNNPNYREKTLQSEQPDVKMIKYKRFSNKHFALELEKNLHLQFEHKRKRGEWFELNHQEIEQIEKLLSE